MRGKAVTHTVIPLGTLQVQNLNLSHIVNKAENVTVAWEDKLKYEVAFHFFPFFLQDIDNTILEQCWRSLR